MALTMIYDGRHRFFTHWVALMVSFAQAAQKGWNLAVCITQPLTFKTGDKVVQKERLNPGIEWMKLTLCFIFEPCSYIEITCFPFESGSKWSYAFITNKTTTISPFQSHHPIKNRKYLSDIQQQNSKTWQTQTTWPRESWAFFKTCHHQNN